MAVNIPWDKILADVDKLASELKCTREEFLLMLACVELRAIHEHLDMIQPDLKKKTQSKKIRAKR